MTALGEPPNYHALLKDETRRKIIEMLAEQEKVGFKDFRDSLKIGVGTLYYHLDILSDFITRDKSRKYMLNDRGRLLYRAMKEGVMPAALRLDRVYQSGVLRWLFLSPILSKMNTSTKWIPLSALILGLGAIGSGLARLDPMLLFYSPTIRSFELIVASFLFYWMGAFFLVDLLAYILYKRIGDDAHLFVCMGVAALPLAIYPYLYMILSLVVSPTILAYTLRGVLLVLQIWGLVLLTSAFSFGKGLRLERALILGLSLLYANIAILIALGNLSIIG